jgi:hypothetical protein
MARLMTDLQHLALCISIVVDPSNDHVKVQRPSPTALATTHSKGGVTLTQLCKGNPASIPDDH